MTKNLFVNDIMTYDAYKNYLTGVIGARPDDLELLDPRTHGRRGPVRQSARAVGPVRQDEDVGGNERKIEFEK